MGLTRPLSALLADSGLALPPGAARVVITGVTCDSRQVEPGHLFIAVRGARLDGSQFIPEAVRRGAAAVVAHEGVAAPTGTVVIPVEDTREAVAAVAQAWYGDPSRDLVMIGVTGTNGKTTVASLIHFLFQQAGRPCGLIGTVEYRAGDRSSPSHNTTPGPLELAALLHEMRRQGMQACAMEVSSHALHQRRVAGVMFQVAVFTNASPEHLDYHKTFDAYRYAKSSLFAMLPPWGTAIVNADDPSSAAMRRRTMARVLQFGLDASADVRIVDLQCTLEGSSGTLVTPQGRSPLRTTLVGRHNLANLAAAASVGVACSISVPTILAAMAEFPGVPGRLEPVMVGQPFPVYVDYAHTDAALEQVLCGLRAVTDRRIILVFGCGGDRDQAKRPRMGAVASRYADHIIVTSDNPRDESPQAIAEAIVAGVAPTASCTVVLDRAEAIRRALGEADAHSIVVIAGKGHETTQIIGDRPVPFDDRQVVRQALADFVGARL